jgi:hypothetical protein
MCFTLSQTGKSQELNINRIYFSVLWACFICWENLRTIYLFPSSIKLQNIKYVGFYWRTWTFINFEATYQFLGIFKNNWFFSLFHNFYQVNLELSPLLLNVCRIIIWKDFNWKMCKKDPYNCGKGPVYTVFNLKITVFLLTFA